MKETPLLDRHKALGARLIDFAGWMLPVQYSSIIEEHHAVRTTAGLFDTSHMTRLRLTGRGVAGFLEALLTLPVDTMPPGRCRYGFMLNPEGGVIDDLILYRLAEADWLLVTNAGTRENDLAWLREHPLPPEATLDEVTDSLAKLDLQGPKAATLLTRALGADEAALPTRFGCTVIETAEGSLLVSRTGYTGEDGFELYPDSGRIGAIWDRLLRHDAVPAGLGARDTLRIEAGLPLYGHELDDTLTPVHAGLERFAAKDIPYTGCEAVAAARRDPATPRLTGFRLEGRRSARHGDTVLRDGQPIGRVTSGSFLPTLGCAAGMSLLDADTAAPGDHIKIAAARCELDGIIAPLPLLTRPPNR